MQVLIVSESCEKLEMLKNNINFLKKWEFQDPLNYFKNNLFTIQLWKQFVCTSLFDCKLKLRQNCQFSQMEGPSLPHIMLKSSFIIQFWWNLAWKIFFGCWLKISPKISKSLIIIQFQWNFVRKFLFEFCLKISNKLKNFINWGPLPQLLNFKNINLLGTIRF